MSEKMHPFLSMLLSGARVQVRKPEVKLTDDERDLADALVVIAQKYGKFNEDGSGIWAGYESPSSNDDARIGVKCSNCVLYQGGDQGRIIALPVAPEGKCRFAIIPDGVVKSWQDGTN
jgi:hypothetical protein